MPARSTLAAMRTRSGPAVGLKRQAHPVVAVREPVVLDQLLVEMPGRVVPGVEQLQNLRHCIDRNAVASQTAKALAIKTFRSFRLSSQRRTDTPRISAACYWLNCFARLREYNSSNFIIRNSCNTLSSASSFLKHLNRTDRMLHPPDISLVSDRRRNSGLKPTKALHKLDVEGTEAVPRRNREGQRGKICATSGPHRSEGVARTEMRAGCCTSDWKWGCIILGRHSSCGSNRMVFLDDLSQDISRI